MTVRVHCDGPNCDVAVLPSVLEHRRLGGNNWRILQTDPGTESLHFHTEKCLNEWVNRS